MDLERIERARNAVSAGRLDALLVRLPENVLMLSGYWPLAGASFLYFPQEADPVLVVPSGEREMASEGWVKDIRVIQSGRLDDANPQEQLRGIFTDIAAGRKLNLGVEQSSEWVAPSYVAGETRVPARPFWEIVENSFSNASIHDATGLIDELKAVKTEQEIEKLRIANGIARMGCDAFAELAVPGNSETMVASGVESAILVNGTGYKGAEKIRSWAWVLSGERTYRAYETYQITSGRRIQRGDWVLMELGVVVDGFWADYSRTVVAGEASGRKAEILEILAVAQEEAVRAARAGARACDVDASARTVIASAGYAGHFFHELGHGIGFRYHEAYPDLRPGNTAPLKAGMVFTVEPGIYIEGFGGARLEDDILVCGRSGERL